MAEINREANNIIAGMKAMAKGKATSDETVVVRWQTLTCCYYPRSDRFLWLFAGRGDITRGLSRRQVISLINIEIEDCRRTRVARTQPETANVNA